MFQLMGLLPRITQTRLLFLMMLVCNAHVDLCSSVCLWVCVCTRSCSSTIWILKYRAIISSDVFIFFAFFILHCTLHCCQRNKIGERTIVTLFPLIMIFAAYNLLMLKSQSSDKQMIWNRRYFSTKQEMIKIIK